MASCTWSGLLGVVEAVVAVEGRVGWEWESDCFQQMGESVRLHSASKQCRKLQREHVVVTRVSGSHACQSHLVVGLDVNNQLGALLGPLLFVFGGKAVLAGETFGEWGGSRALRVVTAGGWICIHQTPSASSHQNHQPTKQPINW